RGTLQRQTDARVDEEGTPELADRGAPGAGNHQEPRGAGRSPAPDQNTGTACPEAFTPHAIVRAVTHRWWHWPDIGPNDRAGKRRYPPFSHRGALRLVLPLCGESQDQQWQA